MATENLKVKITADASQAKAEIGKFKNSLKSTVKESEAATASIGKLTIALGAMVIALKAAKKAIDIAVEVAATGDAIKDNAQKVFMGTTAYQEWGYVLKQNGIELAALKVGMRQFAQHVANGDAALQKYGITATDVDEAFEQAIYHIQNLGSETEKIAAATELFGTRALELMPILNLTNGETQALMETYRAIGGTMSNELIAMSDECTDSIVAMKAAWGGLRNLLAAYVLPTVIKVVQWLTVTIAKARILLAAIFGIKETFGGGGKKSMPKVSESIATNTGNTAKNLKTATKHAKELKRTLMGIDELSRLAEKATAAATGGNTGGNGGTVAVDTSDLEGMGDAMESVFSDEMLQEIQQFQEKISGVADKLNGFYLIVKGLAEITLFNPVQGFKDLWAGLEKLFPSLSTLKEKWDYVKGQIADKVISAKVKIEDLVSGVWKNTISPIWEKAKKIGGTVSAKVALTISDKFSKKWNKIKKNWNSVKNKYATMTLEFKDRLKSGYNSIANAIQRARNKWPATKIILPDIHPLAKGGVLTAPTPALLGEYAGASSNPEIATPQSLMYETIQAANSDLVSAFASMTRQVIAAIEDKDLSVNIGDEQIARSAQRGNTAYYNRTGKALITT